MKRTITVLLAAACAGLLAAPTAQAAWGGGTIDGGPGHVHTTKCWRVPYGTSRWDLPGNRIFQISAWADTGANSYPAALGFQFVNVGTTVDGTWLHYYSPSLHKFLWRGPKPNPNGVSNYAGVHVWFCFSYWN